MWAVFRFDHFSNSRVSATPDNRLDMLLGALHERVIPLVSVMLRIEAIGWRLFRLHRYFFIEMAGKRLEELSEIFNAKHPFKRNLEKNMSKLNLQEGTRMFQDIRLSEGSLRVPWIPVHVLNDFRKQC